MINENKAQRNAPEHQGPAPHTKAATQKKQERRQWKLQQQKIVIQPAVVRHLLHVRGELADVMLGGDIPQHPSKMTPPEAQMTVVMVSGIVGMEVVVAVQTDPIDGTVLTAQGAAGGNEGFKPTRYRKGSVSEQAVVSEGHANTGGQPIKKQENNNRRATPEARHQRHHGQKMNHHHEQSRAPTTRQFPWLHSDTSTKRGCRKREKLVHAGASNEDSIGCKNCCSSKQPNRNFRPSLRKG